MRGGQEADEANLVNRSRHLQLKATVPTGRPTDRAAPSVRYVALWLRIREGLFFCFCGEGRETGEWETEITQLKEDAK